MLLLRYLYTEILHKSRVEHDAFLCSEIRVINEINKKQKKKLAFQRFDRVIAYDPAQVNQNFSFISRHLARKYGAIVLTNPRFLLKVSQTI